MRHLALTAAHIALADAATKAALQHGDLKSTTGRSSLFLCHAAIIAADPAAVPSAFREAVIIPPDLTTATVSALAEAVSEQDFQPVLTFGELTKSALQAAGYDDANPSVSMQQVLDAIEATFAMQADALREMSDRLNTEVKQAEPEPEQVDDFADAMDEPAHKPKTKVRKPAEPEQED
ncbi:hypothetical protein RCDURKIN_64 [Rhodobacter phage RcDurkin]|nr:hypothetical protein RCDURKIN_64 [Rhodobacter phage RcDurkin]